MGLLSAGDLLQMQADLQAVIGDNDVSIVLRREETNLAAQTVRVERKAAGGGKKQSPYAEETRGGLFLAGSTTLDIQKDDRFTLDGRLYRVTFVRTNELIGTLADAEVMQ